MSVSLNEVLLKGPFIQDELLYILLRFRTYKFAFAADVKKKNVLKNMVGLQTPRLSKDLWCKDSTK